MHNRPAPPEALPAAVSDLLIDYLGGPRPSPHEEHDTSPGGADGRTLQCRLELSLAVAVLEAVLTGHDDEAERLVRQVDARLPDATWARRVLDQLLGVDVQTEKRFGVPVSG